MIWTTLGTGPAEDVVTGLEFLVDLPMWSLVGQQDETKKGLSDSWCFEVIAYIYNSMFAIITSQNRLFGVLICPASEQAASWRRTLFLKTLLKCVRNHFLQQEAGKREVKTRFMYSPQFASWKEAWNTADVNAKSWYIQITSYTVHAVTFLTLAKITFRQTGADRKKGPVGFLATCTWTKTFVKPNIWWARKGFPGTESPSKIKQLLRSD